MRVYFDSVILIYLLDDQTDHRARAATRLTSLLSAGDRVAISGLVRMECRVKPIRMGDRPRLASFDRFFEGPSVESVPLTTAVYDLATEIRARYNFKVPDSLHLAAAVSGGCGAFLTNDTRLGRFGGRAVEVLP